MKTNIIIANAARQDLFRVKDGRSPMNRPALYNRCDHATAPFVPAKTRHTPVLTNIRPKNQVAAPPGFQTAFSFLQTQLPALYGKRRCCSAGMPRRRAD